MHPPPKPEPSTQAHEQRQAVHSGGPPLQPPFDTRSPVIERPMTSEITVRTELRLRVKSCFIVSPHLHVKGLELTVSLGDTVMFWAKNSPVNDP